MKSYLSETEAKNYIDIEVVINGENKLLKFESNYCQTLIEAKDKSAFKIIEQLIEYEIYQPIV